MTGDQAGLLVLAGTLVFATAGAWDLLAAGASREALRERATGERSEPRRVRLATVSAPRSSARRPGTACRCTSKGPRCRCAPCPPP